jgi:hypothetical protein
MHQQLVLTTTYFNVILTGVTGGATGAAATWNFTSINTTTAAVANYSTNAATNASYPSADVCCNCFN